MVVQRDKIRSFADRLLSGDEHLSFSSFKEFLKSPAHFIEYKFGKRKTSDAFRTGNLVDTLLLEPQEFDTRYKVFIREDVLPFPEKNYQTKANREARDEFYNSLPENIIGIEDTEFREAENVVKAIRKIKTADGILNMCDAFQTPLDFKYQGFRFKGYKDASCMELTVDLKTTKDASQRGFKRAIRQYGYHYQAFLYNVGDGQIDKPYFIIAVEKESPYAAGVHRIGNSLLMKAQKQIDKGLLDLRRCLLDETLFYQSYEFWADKSYGIFEVDLTYY